MVMVQSVDWSIADEIQKYLEPFHIIASVFNNKSAVSFHMVMHYFFLTSYEI